MKHFFKSCLRACIGGALALLPMLSSAAPFTPGNLVVARVGATGSGTALGSGATAVFLDEYTPAGVLVQSLPLPTAVSGNNRILTSAGSTSSELGLTRSADGRYLVLTGYDAAPGTSAVAATVSGTTNRVIGRIAADGTIDTSTRISDAFSGGVSGTGTPTSGNIRSATTADGSAFYAVGSISGVVYVPFGNAGATTALNTAAPTNNRVVNIFNDNLYVSSASGTFQGISQVGTGLPTAAGTTITLLPGFPSTTGPSPYGFYFADLSTTVPGVDVVYVADDRAAPNGGIQKWSLVGTTWTLNGTITSTTAATLRGLNGSLNGSTVTLAASGAGLFVVTDNAGYNAAPSTTTLPAALATPGANTAFRGVAFAPVSAAAVAALTVSPTGPLTFTTPVNTASATQTVTVGGSNLTGAINVTAPAGYEVATTQAGPYTATISLPATGGTQAATSVFVRLASAAAAATRNGALLIASTGAADVSVLLNGTVTGAQTATPVVTATPAGPLTFTTTAGTASATQTVTVSGSDLTGPLNVTAPAGYEVSLSATGTFTATISLPGTNGTLAATPVFVRLSAAAAAGTRDGGLLIASTGAANVTVLLNGTVAAAPAATPTLTSISPVRAVVGGPAFTLTLEGTNFTATTQVNFGGATYTAATVNTAGTRITVEIPASAIATVGQIVVTATNGGTASATRDFFVVPAATIVSFEDFEQGTKTGYAAGEVVLRSGPWTFTDALIGDMFSDRVNQVKGARVRGAGSIAMNFDKPNGAGIVTILAAAYGTDAPGFFKAEVSTDGGATYTQLTGDAANPTVLTTTLVPFRFTVDRTGNVRFRFTATGTGTTPRINFDDLTITNQGLATRADKALVGLSVFPNPAQDKITVTLPTAGAARVALRDLTGRVVLASAALPATGAFRLPAALPAGVYLLEVQQGAATAVRRVVKE